METILLLSQTETSSHDADTLHLCVFTCIIMHMYNNQCLRMYNWDVMGGALEHTCMIPCLSVTFIQFPFRHITIIGQVTGLL